MRRLGVSRRELFDRLEAGALLDLPAEPFEYAEWRRCRGGLDYHVKVLGYWYIPGWIKRIFVFLVVITGIADCRNKSIYDTFSLNICQKPQHVVVRSEECQDRRVLISETPPEVAYCHVNLEETAAHALIPHHRLNPDDASKAGTS